MKKFTGILSLFLILAFASLGQSAKEWNKQGTDHFTKMEYKQAFECFTKAIDLDAKYGEAYYNRANAWFQLPSGAYPDHNGCDDLKKAKSVGFKAAEKKLKEFGCK